MLHEELLRLHAVLEVGDLVRATFALMRRALPLHLQSLALWPDDRRNSAFFRDRCPLKTRAQTDRYACLCPLSARLRRRPECRVLRQSDCLSLGEVRRTPFYRAFMVPEGWLYQCVLVFWHHGTPLGSLTLHRRADQGDFSGSEMQLLEALHPHLAAALRRVHRLNQERGERTSAESMLARLPLPVILADWNLRILFANREAARLCATAALGPQARLLKLPRRLMLPPSVGRLCRHLKARGTAGGATEALPAPVARHHPADEGGDHAWTAHVSLQAVEQAPFNKPVFLIHFSPAADAAGRSAIPPHPSLLAHLVNLTASERRVALLARDGLSNSEVARRLGKSPHTVAKQLQTTFRKLGVSNRTRLAALIR